MGLGPFIGWEEEMPDHHPPHLYLNNTWYVVSASTLSQEHFLGGDEAKTLVRDVLREFVLKFDLSLRAWVVLNNHYHLLLKTNHGRNLPRFFTELHGRTARRINQIDGVSDRQVWHNYWDTSIRTERDLWTRFNYIHQNPVKHGYVKRSEDWPFSSYGYHLRTKGNDWMRDCWERYPVVDFLEGDDF